MADKHRRFVDKLIKDKDGHIALWAWPNLPLWIWIIMKVLEWPLTGTAESTAGDVATAALLSWSLLELVQGVNYFRRTVGCLVLILTVTSAMM